VNQTYETLLYEVSGRVATVTLNRPKQANSVTMQTMADYLAVVDGVNKDDDVRVVIFTAAGDQHFCAGADLKEVTATLARGDKIEFPPGPFFMDAIASIPKPTIAVIQGKAVGGGCELALACDFRFMANDTVIGLPELKFGQIPAAGGTQRLPRIVGYAKAIDLLLTGRLLEAQEAVSIGLITAALPRDQLFEGAATFAEELTRRAPYVVQAAKFLASRAFDMPVLEGCELERRTSRTMATPEEKEAAQAEAARGDGTYAKLFAKA
jgi:enoyl-CoA hydratase/carnithine racemase